MTYNFYNLDKDMAGKWRAFVNFTSETENFTQAFKFDHLPTEEEVNAEAEKFIANREQPTEPTE